MSILIKDMEMPKEKSVIIQIYPDGTVRRLDGRVYKSHTEAVPVPAHGRLIDADALITTFCEWGTSLENKGKFVITMAEAKQTIVDIIEDAPTIIPASGGNDNE